jgi:hypothetical protein
MFEASFLVCRFFFILRDEKEPTKGILMSTLNTYQEKP